MKQQFIKTLRRLRLLPLAERVRLSLLIMQNYRSNRIFAKSISGFSFPPYDVAYDAYGSIDYETYYMNGRKAATFIYDILSEELPQKHIKICEWGCGPGRIIRHLPSIDSTKRLEVYGTDYNQKTIRWCKENIKVGDIEFSPNKLAPPLPFKSNFLDCLYSVSVYTHLSEEMHFAWLQENLRVVRPGGLILMTTHGDKSKNKLLHEEVDSYETGKLVVRGDVVEGTRSYCAFHSPSFMRNTFLKGLEIVLHDSSPDPVIAGPQDVWVVRKT